MRNGWLAGAVLVLCLMQGALAADLHFSRFDEDEVPWQEEGLKLPAFPSEENLLEFFVSAVTPNRFYVDGTSISVGADGVVRFALVIKTVGGATNVSYEGIRCGVQETRYYATGVKGAWTPMKNSAWKLIENKPINRHHAALNRDYFCPANLPIRTPEEGRDALRRGRHPAAL